MPPQAMMQERHHGAMVRDKADLDIHTDILVQVAGRRVRLGAEDGRDLENTLEDADHDLLVELRALRETGTPVEIVHGEEVRAALPSHPRRASACEFPCSRAR